MGKKVVIGSEARDKMKEGVDILANAVKATLGPRGRHAAIERKSGPPLITKDGVTVARYISLDDRIQNMGAQLIKSVASYANAEAGDGTTTATVLAQEIYGRGLKYVSNGNNPVLVKRGIDLAVEKVVDHLKTISIQVSDETTLAHVATISANNNPTLGKMIAEAVSAVGNDGIVSVEEATGSATEVQYSDGIKLEKGLLSEEFITNSMKSTCEMEDPYILLYDSEVKNVHMLVNILNQVIQEGRQILLVVKTIDPEPLTHLVLNKMKNVIRCCVVRAPGFGDHRRAILEDLSVLTGAKLFTNSDGRELRDATIADLGSARKVVVGLNSTNIINGSHSRDNIEMAIAQIKNRLSDPTIYGDQKEILRSRLSRLSGGVAIFKVGGTSESEMREKKDRVEDAINAVRSALSEGVVPGGGCALLHCLKALDKIDRNSLLEEEVVGIEVVRSALKAPFMQILSNSGMEEERSEYMRRVVDSESFSGFDALRLEFVENMLERGIVDPARVVRSSLVHAASASGILLTTEVSISEDESLED
jgi:chaperonin GroEL